ncbi:uncharacterized protein LOC106176200 [Lingula anatina]|uniref:Uncharacterized protein LOC106176200 n=1 Tax=Lingula anatina TaxID=7574 RepID=A0A1S3JUB8_LINAN|nr:uncharacterized protein LOC106176200 [Lingula anatina]|eukprot:XP_013413918.1 uncharacterized protein LOC106176200 [Lingula anatina]
MTSLVADYGSASDSDEEYDPKNHALSESGPKPSQITEKSSYGGNLLGLHDQSDDSSSGEDVNNKQRVLGDLKEQPRDKSLPNPFGNAMKLPAPSLNVEKEQGGKGLENSVFANPFEKARQAKLSVLEKHVKMTETEEQAQSSTSNRNVCYKFLKGKCHFGDKCRFYHERDNVHNISQPVAGHQNQFNAGRYNQTGNFELLNFEQDQQDEDGYMANMKRKKRAGINDHLVPPKKALQSLGQQRAKERPWTVGT